MEKICCHCGLGKRKLLDRFIKRGEIYYHKDCLANPETEFNYRGKYESDKRKTKIFQELEKNKISEEEVINERKRQIEEESVKKYRLNFSQIKFDFKNEDEAVIEIDYKKPVEFRTRLFFGKDGSDKIYSKDYLEKSESNFIHLKVIPSKKQNSTSWIKKGLHNVGDNFESGYTVAILLRDADPKLRKYIIDVLNSFKFGSLPTARTIYAHLDDDFPHDGKAKEYLEKITREISKF